MTSIYFTRLAAIASAYMLMGIASTPAKAWGAQGHKIIANIAQAQLAPAAKRNVQQLLDLELGSTLASISTWADETRNPATAPWHYVNFPRMTCEYEPERDCPDGKCVVGAIDRQIEVLQSSTSDEKKLLALKYVVHLVGDVHQPLHAGYLDDKGGNTYQLQAFMRGSNLHVLWDTLLIRNLNEDVPDTTARLLKSTVKTSEFTASKAAEESCQIVGTPGYYPDRLVGQDYIDKFTPVMEQRLSLAGARLAAVLNRVFR